MNTGLIQIDYGGHCLDAGSAGSTPTVTSSCNQNSAGQRWAFYRVAGDYVIESDTALCINTVPDNGSITMQPCTGDSGSELFNIDNSP